MAQVNTVFPTEARFETARGDSKTADFSYQAFRMLQLGFVVAPIVAGVDKFLHLLVDWDKYLPPVANSMLGGHGHQLMMVAGAVEIVAGIGIALKPRIFAYIVALWLGLIIINVVLAGYYDVGLRDVGLMLGALALGRLSHEFDA